MSVAPHQDISVLLEERARVAEEMLACESELQRQYYLARPVEWARDRLGDFLWSGQRRIIESVRDHRKTSVATCHEVGKTRIAAVATGWWLDSFPPGDAYVVTTAPTARQVRAVLWREINRVHARGSLYGRTNQVEWLMVTPLGKEEQVAIGRKPDEYQVGSFQGLHQRYLLFIGDEACGIPLQLLIEAESLIANDNSKMLLIGNPDDPKTEFGRICKPGSGYNVIQIGAFDTPNFTGEQVPHELREHLIGYRYVEDMRRRWARSWTWNEDRTRLVPPPATDPKRTNPYFQSKVLGLFPSVLDDDGYFRLPIQWIEDARRRTLAPIGPNELSVDVGGGGDASTIGHRQGPRFRIKHEDTNPDTMATCNKACELQDELQADCVKVDMIGIGRGVVDRGKELHRNFIGINVGMAPFEDEEMPDEVKKLIGTGFLNLRAQLYWNLWTLLENGVMDLEEEDEQLAAELAEIRFKRTPGGKIQVEGKAEMLARGVPSPNRADALMMGFAPPVEFEENGLEGMVAW